MYKNKLDSMIWSYSRLQCFENCPQAFYLKYIEQIENNKSNSFFSDYGTFIHKILEQYYSYDLSLFELADKYKDEYNYNIRSMPPYNNQKIADKYLEAGLSYFETFDDPFNQYKIIGVEEHFTFEIDGYKFQGFIDLIAQKQNGDIIVIDHKTQSAPKIKKEKEKLFRQLYIYSRYVYEKYEKYPTKLLINLVREGKILEEEFNIDTYNSSLFWLTDTIKQIYNTDGFAHKEKMCNSSYYCQWLCDGYEFCLDPARYEKKKKDLSI